MKSNEDTVKAAISDILGISPADIELEQQLARDLDADSLDVVEVVMALEDEFDIAIPDEEVTSLDVTVQELLSAVERCLKEPKS